jgi:response regulator RpfG family c-di-GMP phosphodiesterase
MSNISRRVLCIDDEPALLAGIERKLRGRVDLTTAVGGKAGLAALAEKGPFAVVISDYMMPEMNGVEVLKEVARVAPDSVRMMLTGCSDLEVAVSALNEGGIWRFLSKPCSRDAMENAIREAQEHYRLILAERELTGALNQANDDLRQLNEGLEERVRERTATISQLRRFVTELSGMDSIANMADLIVTKTAEMLSSQRVSLMMPDASGEYLVVIASVGLTPEARDRIRVPVGAPIAGVAFAENRSIVVNDAEQAAAGSPRYDSEFFAVVPLISTGLGTPGHTIGVLNVTEHVDGLPYDKDALAALETIRESATIALQNQIRLQERNEARDAIILALAKLAEHRDPETGAHLDRVRIYCRLLSETLARNPRYSLRIDQEFISAIYNSSPLHDIGKVGIPDAILLKPGPLTHEEFEVMKTHSTIGGNTIRTLVQQRRPQRFLQMGMEIAYHHHERYDGAGYPAGLAGEKIPLSARILTVADVYDAMVSRRVYKPALSHEEAVAFIREGAGKKFDPDIADVFLRLHEDFRTIAKEVRDEEPIVDARSEPLTAQPSPA